MLYDIAMMFDVHHEHFYKPNCEPYCCGIDDKKTLLMIWKEFCDGGEKRRSYDTNVFFSTG